MHSKSPAYATDPKTAAHSQRAFFAPAIQAKLTENKPGGQVEQEADAVGQSFLPVAHQDSGALQNGAVQRVCTECEKEEKLQRQEEKEQEELPVQRKEISPDVNEVPEEDIQRKCLECEQEEKERVQREEMGPEEQNQVQRQGDSVSIQSTSTMEQASMTIQPQSTNNVPTGPSDAVSPHTPIPNQRPAVMQAGLKVGAPDSYFEREADEMAEKVQRMPLRQMQIPNDGITSATDTTGVQRQEDEDESTPDIQGKIVQRTPGLQRSADGALSTSAQFTTRMQTAGGGSPLPEATHQQMGNAFGADFGTVRIHTDTEAAQLSGDIGARAFTYQNHIYFNEGEYNPATPEGQGLLAHELTHTVQQGAVVRRLPNETSAASSPTSPGSPRSAPSSPATASSRPSVEIPSTPTASATPPAAPGRTESLAGPAQPGEAAGVPAPAAGPGHNTSAGITPGQGGGAPAAPASGGGGALLSPEPLMPEPPSELGPEAQHRLEHVQSNAEQRASASADLPPASENTADARAGVTEPTEETQAVASGALAAELNQRPEPSPEIEELCTRIREVIRAQRPPDEDSLLSADPEEAANEAGTQLNENVSSDADRVGSEYNSMDNPPEGERQQEGEDIETPPVGVDVSPADAADAAPDPVPEADVSLDEDVENTSAAMEEAGMSTEVADAIQDPDNPVVAAREAHGELEETAQESPAEVLAQQDVAIANAQADMQSLQAQALQVLQQSRANSISGTRGQQTAMVGTEAQRRAAIGRQAEAIFTDAQNQVNQLLEPLTRTAMEMWDTAKARLATEFRQHLDRVQRWVDERHSGVGGFFVSIGDYFTGLPDWVTEEYNDAERAFGDGVCEKIREISAYVNGVVAACEEIINNADQSISTLFENARNDLGDWAVQEQARFAGRLSGLRDQVRETQQNFTRDLANRAAESVQEVRQEIHALRQAARGLIGAIADAIQEFLDDPIRFIINGLLSLVGIEPPRFWALVDRIGQVIADIAEDPLGFAENLLSAIGTGFEQFFDNFGTHLLDALIEWLFSGLGAMGIQVPRELSLPNIISFFLQLMGFTWDRIRRLLAKHIGEENVAIIEQAFQLISSLIEKGPLGIFDFIKDLLNPQNILDMIIRAAVDFLVEKIVEQVAVRLLLMFNPVGAIAQAIEAIYKVLKWIFQNAARIFSLIETVVNGMADIVAGNISGMANAVEQALARLLVPVIDFIAELFSLGDLPEHVADVVRGMQEWMEGLMDRAIGWLANQARALARRLGIGGEEEEDGGAEGELEDSEVGETMTFTAGEESHRLWISSEGAGIAPMVASDTPKSVEEKLNEWEGKIDDLSDENKDQARGLIATARQQNQTVISEGTEAKQEIEEARETPEPEEVAQANQADQETESAETALKGTLAQSFDEFHVVPIPQMIVSPGFSSNKANGTITVRYMANESGNHDPGTGTTGREDLHGAFTEIDRIGVRANWKRGHLINRKFGGKAENSNLIPITTSINNGIYPRFDNDLEGIYTDNDKKVIWMQITVSRNHEEDPSGLFVSHLTVNAGIMNVEGGKWEVSHENDVSPIDIDIEKPSSPTSGMSINNLIQNNIINQGQVRLVASNNDLSEGLIRGLIDQGVVLSAIDDISDYIRDNSEWTEYKKSRELSRFNRARANHRITL